MITKDGMKENNFEVIRPGINTTYQDFGRKNLDRKYRCQIIWQ